MADDAVPINHRRISNTPTELNCRYMKSSLMNIWNIEVLSKIVFPNNLKLGQITLVF